MFGFPAAVTRSKALSISALLALLLPSPAPGAIIPETIVNALSERVRGNDITIVGETHRRSESAQLLTALAEAATRDGRCLSVALEIDGDQNDELAAIMRGEAPVEELSVWPAIDHPGFRAMIGNLQGLAASGHCLTAHAVDLPKQLWDSGFGRDEWMADQLAELAGAGPVLAWVGNLHVLRKVRWPSGEDRPYLAERLIRRGVRVQSILQGWQSGHCADLVAGWHAGDGPLAIIHIERVLGLTSAVRPDDAAGVTDGLVLWSCTPAPSG